MTTHTEPRLGLDAHGIVNVSRVHWNLTTPALYEEAIRRREGLVAHAGPLVCRTGHHTAGRRTTSSSSRTRQPRITCAGGR